MFQSKFARSAAVLLAGASITAGLAGCEESSRRDSGRTKQSGPAQVTDLGEGVFQFPAADWPNSLVQFRQSHPELRIVDTELATSTGDGDPTSFVVITEKKN